MNSVPDRACLGLQMRLMPLVPRGMSLSLEGEGDSENHVGAAEPDGWL